MAFDTQLLYLLNNVAGQSPFLDGIIVFFATYLAYILILIFLVLVLFSHYQKREKWEILLVTGISAVIARFGITELIRFFYHHPRPSVYQLLAENSWSFPSGHAMFFFALATAIYLYNKRWGFWFYIAAVLIGVARVMAGVHYPSDIVGGAILGSLTAYIVFCIAKKWVGKPTD